MSNKDKDALTRLKAYFRSSRAPTNEVVELVLTPEREQELSPRAPIQQRLRSLENLSKDLQQKRLEAGSLHKLWELTQDLLNSDRPADQRQHEEFVTLRRAGFTFYQKVIASQYDHLAEMRVHFFRVIQGHSVAEDIDDRLALLNTLTNSGKNIKLIDKDIGEFMLNWSQAVLEANLMAEYLEIVCNMIQFNAACLEKPFIAGIVNLCCALISAKPVEKGEDLVPTYLSLIDSVIAYSFLPMESLTSCIVALCRTGACQEYSFKSYEIMRRLLGTALGHAAIWTMCSLLNDSTRRKDERLLCGAVYYTNLSLWGPSPAPTASLRFSISVVLKSFLEVIQLNHWHVTYEVLKSVQLLIQKQGGHLNEVTWDLVCQIFTAAVNNDQHVRRSDQPNSAGSNQIPVLFHETVSVAEEMLAENRFHVDATNFYSLIERIKDHRDERSVQLLMSHKLDLIVVTRPRWIQALGQFVDKFYRQETRTNIRVICVESLKTVMRMNRAAYEDEILERVVLANFATVTQERDLTVRKAVNRMLLEFAKTCDTKRSLDLLNIVENQMNIPFSTQHQQLGGLIGDVDTLVALVDGLIEVFLVKLYVRPVRPDESSSHATQVFHMLMGHLEKHYEQMIIGDYSEVRYKLFEWMFKARANAAFRLGYPDPETGKVRFSNYLGVDARKPIFPLREKETAGGGGREGETGGDRSGPEHHITTISIRRGCQVIVKCLEMETCWRVWELVLTELPKILQNKALIMGNDMDSLGKTLCAKFKNRKSVAEQFATPPDYDAKDIQSLLLLAMTSLMTYNQTLNVLTQKQLLDSLVNGGISLQLASITVPAMTVMLLEIPDMIFRCVPDILLVLSKLSATPQVAVPVLEFLSTLTRLPQARFGNFTSSQSLYVFAVALPYTNPYRYNHYIVSLAHHVIAGWFLKSRLKFRYNFVKYIVTGLDQHIDKAFPSALVNEDSSNRKRSSSLKERGTGKERGRELVVNTKHELHEFHMELAETCIDFMAKHTYSPCVAQPKRLPATNFMLAGGQSMSWLLGHNLITITTSGCAGVAKNGTCDRCSVFCKVPFQGAEGGGGVMSSSGIAVSGFGPQKSAHDSESSDLTSTTSTSTSNLIAGAAQLLPQGQTQRFLLQRQSSSEGAGRFSSTSSGSLEALSRRGSNPDSAEQQDHLDHPIAGRTGVAATGSAGSQTFVGQDPMIRQLCTCACVGWAEIVVRRPTGSMSWVMRIQNQMQQDLFAGDDVFSTMHDISNLFMPNFGAMSMRAAVEVESPKGGVTVATSNKAAEGKEVEKFAQAAGFNFSDKLEEKRKEEQVQLTGVTPVQASAAAAAASKATSGPIAIPKQPKPAKESGSISDHDSEDGGVGLEDEGDDQRRMRNEEEDNEDDDDDDDELGSRSRNPVRRVNSSPEMSSNYRNPYLMAQNKQKEMLAAAAAAAAAGNSATVGAVVDGSEGEIGGGGGTTSSSSEAQQWKKGFAKDPRVSCEAIPEEMTGQTPPSRVGSVASNEGVLSAELITDKEQKARLLFVVESRPSPGGVLKKDEADLTTAVTVMAIKNSPIKQQHRQSSGGGAEEGLKLQVNLKIPPEKSSAPSSAAAAAVVVTTKPPQSPAPLSPRLLAKNAVSSSSSSMAHRTLIMDHSGGVGMMPFGGGPPVGSEEMWRGRSNTISVVQERHTKHSMLRGRNATGASGSNSSGLGSAVSSSGSIPSSTRGSSGRSSAGAGAADGGPRPSGISPSFVFLQLFHSDQKPLLVDSGNESAIKLLDLIPPMEVHKVGVLYKGPGQANDEVEILKNRCGSYRYTKFLSGLGSLLSVRQASNSYTSLDPKNAMDGKFTYIWQDDIAQVQYHVATLMPTREDTDPKCGEKKKNIGNDFVMIIYNESGEEYSPNTLRGHFNYASVVVEPLEMRSNRISVKVRDNLIDMRWEPKIVSDECAPLLARQLALHANLASLVTRSLKTNTNVPYASSWLERLRSIKRLRKKILESNRQDATSSSTGNLAAGGGGAGPGGIMGASDHQQQQQQNQQQQHGGGGVSAQALARKYQMDDFTTYTQ